jgi:hypothetical protein
MIRAEQSRERLDVMILNTVNKECSMKSRRRRQECLGKEQPYATTKILGRLRQFWLLRAAPSGRLAAAVLGIDCDWSRRAVYVAVNSTLH